jgi:hypothetical protein
MQDWWKMQEDAEVPGLKKESDPFSSLFERKLEVEDLVRYLQCFPFHYQESYPLLFLFSLPSFTTLRQFIGLLTLNEILFLVLLEQLTAPHIFAPEFTLAHWNTTVEI